MTTEVLYVKYTCSFCIKVLKHLKDNNINIPVVDVTKGNNREYLVEHGGKPQVPCLFIDGKPMYESDTIIKHLKSNK